MKDLLVVLLAFAVLIGVAFLLVHNYDEYIAPHMDVFWSAVGAMLALVLLMRPWRKKKNAE